jgi:hypothetical protein
MLSCSTLIFMTLILMLNKCSFNKQRYMFIYHMFEEHMVQIILFESVLAFWLFYFTSFTVNWVHQSTCLFCHMMSSWDSLMNWEFLSTILIFWWRWATFFITRLFYESSICINRVDDRIKAIFDYGSIMLKEQKKRKESNKTFFIY